MFALLIVIISAIVMHLVYTQVISQRHIRDLKRSGGFSAKQLRQARLWTLVAWDAMIQDWYHGEALAWRKTLGLTVVLVHFALTLTTMIKLGLDLRHYAWVMAIYPVYYYGARLTILLIEELDEWRQRRDLMRRLNQRNSSR